MKFSSKHKLSIAISAALLGSTLSGINFAYDEYHSDYTLSDVVVTAQRVTNEFGDTNTEQSYYRTGGDVKVITREEIEQRHYTDLTDAIKRIPGITFQNPGYRGGEYGYQFYNNGVSINGDTRVIILMDGRRVDNLASTRLSSNSKSGSKGTGVNLDQLTDIDNVDKIEVIKGPGASVYGSDATGGVINIITRQGGKTTKVTTDIGAGSWGKRKYNVTYSGPVSQDKNTRLFFQGTKVSSNDTHYVDGITKEDSTLAGSAYNEKGADLRLTRDFSNNRKLDISFNYKSGHDGYPIATPNMFYWNKADWQRIIFNAVVGNLNSNGAVTSSTKSLYGDANNPGYHNLYALDGNYGSYSEFNNKDLDITYTFREEKGLPSFVRAYYQKHYFSSRDVYHWTPLGKTSANMRALFKSLYPNGSTTEEQAAFAEQYLAPFPGDKTALNQWINSTGGYAGGVNAWNIERNSGIQLQYAHIIGKHDLIAQATYDSAHNTAYDHSNDTPESADISRQSFYGYMQDKIHINPDWALTPSLRFVHYSGVSNTENGSNQTLDNSSSTAVTGALNTEFNLSKSLNGYVGIANIYRPLRPGDYALTTVLGGSLTPERGMVYTAGLRKTIGQDTVVGLNYALTDMTSAVATLPILKAGDDRPKTGAVNAKERRQAINLTLDRYIGEHWTISAAYTHMTDVWKAKGFTMPDDYKTYLNASDINTMINDLRPKNRYSLNINYDNNKFSSSMLFNLYAGNNTRYFTAKNFLVIDWSLNYNFNDALSTYLVINNLTNVAYQTSYNAYNGIDSSSMPSRNYMLGIKYKF